MKKILLIGLCSGLCACQSAYPPQGKNSVGAFTLSPQLNTRTTIILETKALSGATTNPGSTQTQIKIDTAPLATPTPTPLKTSLPKETEATKVAPKATPPTSPAKPPASKPTATKPPSEATKPSSETTKKTPKKRAKKSEAETKNGQEKNSSRANPKNELDNAPKISQE